MSHDPLRWPPDLDPPRPRGRGCFLVALVAVAAAWFRLGPITETTPLDVVIRSAPEPGGDRVVETLAASLEAQPGVRSVMVEPAGAEPCEETLARLVAEPRPGPLAVILVNPAGGDDPAGAARLGASARRSGVTVGAVVDRPGAASGVSILLPGRWAAGPRTPGRPRGNGATVMISVTNLRSLPPPVKLFLRGPSPGAWDTVALGQLLAGEAVVESTPDGSAVVTLDLTRTPNDALLYLRTGQDVAAAGMPWLEAELRSGAGRVAVDRWAPATRPPKVLLVPSLAFCAQTPPATPALPRPAGQLGTHRGPPWSLLQGVEHPGLVVVWPRSHDRFLDAVLGPGHAAELEQTGAILRTLPNVSETAATRYAAVVIDASLPVGLTREAQPDGEKLLAGGLLSTGAFPTDQISRFERDLQAYVATGGTLMLVGASVFAWEDRPDTLRSLLRRVAPGLADFTPAPRRGRWVFGIDNSESMTSADHAAIATLPPLLTDKNVLIPYDIHTAAQYERLTGRPASREGDKLVQPTRQSLSRALLGRIQGGGADDNDIEAQNIAVGQLVDTPAELAHVAVDHLLATFGHPELMPEVNGRPAFRRREVRDAAVDNEPDAWAFAHPFTGDEARDLFGTHFAFSDRALFQKPSATSPRASCVEWASFRDYLASQVFRDVPARGLAWGFFDATDTGEAGSNTVWRLVDSSGPKPLLETMLPSRSLPSSRHRFFFFAVREPKAPPDHCGNDIGLDLSPGPSLLKRFLRHGRGRWLSLLEYLAARDLAMLRGEVAPGAIDALRRADASPETMDIFRRNVQEELQPAFATPYRPSSAWTTLARTTDGDPLAATATVGRGTVVLALVEPPHDRSLDERSRDPAQGWVDFSPLLLDPTEDKPGTPVDVGFQLARVRDEYHVTAHAVRREGGRDFWPPITSPDPIAATAEVTLRVHAGWSVKNGLPGLPDQIVTEPTKPWVVPLGRLQVPPVAPGSTDLRILELEIGPVGERRSVFAPLPATLVNPPPSEDPGDTPPATRLVDLLLEVFARKPTWRVERIARRRTIRLVGHAATAEAPPLKLMAEGEEIPRSVWALDGSLPGQWLVRLGADAAWRGNEIEVQVGSSNDVETHVIDGFSADQPDQPIRLLPSHDAGPSPMPSTGVLDALAIATGPPLPPAEGEFTAGDRGVIDVRFDGSTETDRQLAEFAIDFARSRTETRTTRHWYLVAFALSVVGIAVRRRALARDWIT